MQPLKDSITIFNDFLSLEEFTEFTEWIDALPPTQQMLKLDEYPTLSVCQQVMWAVKRIIHPETKPKELAIFSGTLVNINHEFPPSQVHTDLLPNNVDGIQAVLYTRREWNMNWGAEFLLLEDDGVTIERAVEYRPNRLVVFDAYRYHVVRSPCNNGEWRRSITFRFFKQNWGLG